MSIAEIKQKIQVLTSELNEIETNISDPIIRNEQKRQLKKEIKKLQQLKSQRQEQQELESLRSEYSSNSDREIEQQQDIPDNNSTSTINLDKQIENNNNDRVNHTDYRQTSSDTISSTTHSSNNKKKSGKALIIAGGIGLLFSLGLLINKNQNNKTAIDTPIETKSPSSNPVDRNINTSQSRENQSRSINDFDNVKFPLVSCGDKDPGGTNTWYPVNVVNTQQNLNIIKNNYCFDAFIKSKNINEGEIKFIQVASFIDPAKAEEFAKLIKREIKSSHVGEPTVRSLDNINDKKTNNQTQSSSSLTQQKAVNLISKWQQAKNRILAPPFDRQLGYQILTGKAYDTKIKRQDGRESAVEWLENHNSFYTYQLQQIDDVKNFQANGDRAVIEVVISEQRTLCYTNKYGQVKPSKDKNTIYDRSLNRYYLERQQGQWKISNYLTVRRIESNENFAKYCPQNFSQRNKNKQISNKTNNPVSYNTKSNINYTNIKTPQQQINELTDRTFYSRYPELKGRKIRDDETYLKQEWRKIRECEATVDYLFYQKYPNLQGKKISKKEKHLVREWLNIKKNTMGCK